MTASQAADYGIGRERLRSSDVAHPFQGVNVFDQGTLGLEQRCRALQTKLPRFARFSGITAALLTGVPLPPRLKLDNTVHVAVPRGNRTLVGRGIRGHTYLRTPGDSRDWRGLRLSSVERMWCELAADLALEDLVAAGDYVVHHRLPHTSIPLLERAVDGWPSRRGRRKLADALGLLDVSAESPQESRLRVILTLGGVRGLVANLPLRTSGGYSYRLDIGIPAHRVFIEYQSDEHHTGTRRGDLTRLSRIQADGWFGIEVGADDLNEPVELCDRIHRVLAARPVQ